MEPNRTKPGPMGRVEALYLATGKGGPMVPIESVEAVAGRGLAGNRYYEGAGTFSGKAGQGRQLTLIESEAVAALATERGIVLPPGASRCNVVTSGVRLEDLVGRRFRIGDVECLGVRPCDPCGHLERLTVAGVHAGLTGRRGLRADILGGGRVRIGDAIDPGDDTRASGAPLRGVGCPTRGGPGVQGPRR